MDTKVYKTSVGGLSKNKDAEVIKASLENMYQVII